MSETYHLCCVTCRESIWIGQGYSATLYFYSGDPETLVAFNEFLRKHLTTWKDRHELVFTDLENAMETEHCTEVDIPEHDHAKPYFYWTLARGEETIELREYKGVIVPDNELLTPRVRQLLSEGWTPVTVRAGR